jgi:nitroreductase
MNPTPQVGVRIQDPGSVDAAIQSRFSARAFRSDPVPRSVLEHILAVASRAPSGSNAQPWKVYVVQGARRDELVRRTCEAHDALAADPSLAPGFRGDQYQYYPRHWVSPYLERRRENGWGLYGLLGIGKGDKDKMHAQHQRNFRLFDAPVALMITIDRVMDAGSLVDTGMFLQNVMIAARAQGLHTCPQAAWNDFAALVLSTLGASDNEMLVCGMALGFADETARVNTFHTPREPVAAFTRWLE